MSALHYIYKQVFSVASFLLLTTFALAQDGPQPPPSAAAPAAAQPAAPKPAATSTATQAAPSKPAAAAQPMPTVIPGKGALPPGAILVPSTPVKPKVKKKPLLGTETAVVTPGQVPANGIASPTAAKPTTAVPSMPPMPRNPFELKSHSVAPTPPATPSTASSSTASASSSTATVATPAPKADTSKKVAVAVPYKGDVNNPFDLPPNTPSTSKEDVKGGNATASSLSNVDNTISKPEKTPWENPFKKIFNRSDKEESHFILFAVLFGALIYLAFVMTVYQPQVSKIWGAFTNEQALASLYRERGGQMSFHYWVIYTLFAVSTGVFCYQIAHYFGARMHSALLGLGLCMFGVALVTFFRHTFLKIIAAIFPFFKEVNLYIFTITIFHLAMGLLLVPFVIFIAFAPASMQTVALYAGLGLVGFIYILRSVRGLMIATKYILEYRFHFLLYLCAVEIAPLLILIKLGM